MLVFQRAQAGRTAAMAVVMMAVRVAESEAHVVLKGYLKTVNRATRLF